MSNLMKSMILAVILVTCGIVNAECGNGFCLKPYFSAEMQSRNLNFHRSGIKKSIHLNSIHLSHIMKFNENFGLEIGAHHSRRASFDKHKSKGLNIRALGFIPLYDNLDLFGGAGFLHLKSSLHKKEDGSYAVKLSKAVPHLVAGVQYMFTDNLGIRTSFSWENTRRIKGDELKLRDSYLYNVGLLFAI